MEDYRVHGVDDVPQEGKTMTMLGLAVVTGAASGIGKAIAELLRDEGAEVLAVDRDAGGLSLLDGMQTLTVDLAETAGRDAAVAAASGARYLVNAAGVILVKPILDCTVEDLHRVFSVNVDATWDLTSRIGAAMAAGGAIVNLSSTAAHINSSTETAIYSASKAAVISITRSFAHAFAPDVRVNAVCPGMTDTAMQDTVQQQLAEIRGITVDEVVASRMQSLPLKRVGTAAECAGVIRFLLSDEAGYLTGQAISNDGGFVMA
jgi:NAD(P)-dependent dehydrogenase (short-subunit alcohol dehydrogenase family)